MLARKFTLFASLLMAGALALGLGGCGGAGSSTNAVGDVRGVNAMVGTSSGINMYLRVPNTTPALNGSSPLAFEGVTSFMTEAVGSPVNDFVVLPGASTSIATSSYDIVADNNYTLVAYGDTSQASGSTYGPNISQYNDNPSASLLTATTAAVRFINLAPTSSANYQSITVYNGSSPVTSTSSSAPLAQTYATASGYIAVTGGAYNLNLRNSTNGTALPLKSTTLASQSLAAGHAYTLIAVGSPTSTSQPFDLIVLTDQ